MAGEVDTRKRCATCDEFYDAAYDGCPFCARDTADKVRIAELEREVAGLRAGAAAATSARPRVSGKTMRLTALVLLCVQSLLVIGYGLRFLPALFQGGPGGVVLAALLSPVLWVAVWFAAMSDSRDGKSALKSDIRESTLAQFLAVYAGIVAVSAVLAAAG